MKKSTLLLFVLAHFSCLFAQKGVFEMGVYGGKNLSYPVNFKENRSHWAFKPLSSFQLGLSLGS
jgi:hypothetical protein